MQQVKLTLMDIQLLKENIKGIDIYILDQILKDRYQPGDKIFDAGCGNGRNLKWFYSNGIEIHGNDLDLNCLKHCRELYPNNQNNFINGSIEQMFYHSNNFDHILCNAVLHFANDLSHYLKMFEELLRILKPQGSLIIRMASNFGIENQVIEINNGVYKLPDGSTRFLLTQNILNDMQNRKDLTFLENVKTTIVHNQRSMTTLLLKKE